MVPRRCIPVKFIYGMGIERSRSKRLSCGGKPENGSVEVPEVERVAGAAQEAASEHPVIVHGVQRW